MRQAIASKVTLPSLSVTRHVSLFQECFHSYFKIDLEIFRFIRMKCISSYCKRKNIMIYRIIWNVFFIQWVARGKYRLSLFCITLKVSQALPHAYVSIRSPWRPGIPRHFASHVTHRSTLIGPLAQLQSCSRNWEEAQIEVNFVIFGGLTSWFFGLTMFWNSW